MTTIELIKSDKPDEICNYCKQVGHYCKVEVDGVYLVNCPSLKKRVCNSCTARKMFHNPELSFNEAKVCGHTEDRCKRPFCSYCKKDGHLLKRNGKLNCRVAIAKNNSNSNTINKNNITKKSNTINKENFPPLQKPIPVKEKPCSPYLMALKSIPSPSPISDRPVSEASTSDMMDLPKPSNFTKKPPRDIDFCDSESEPSSLNTSFEESEPSSPKTDDKYDKNCTDMHCDGNCGDPYCFSGMSEELSCC